MRARAATRCGWCSTRAPSLLRGACAIKGVDGPISPFLSVRHTTTCARGVSRRAPPHPRHPPFVKGGVVLVGSEKVQVGFSRSLLTTARSTTSPSVKVSLVGVGSPDDACLSRIRACASNICNIRFMWCRGYPGVVHTQPYKHSRRLFLTSLCQLASQRNEMTFCAPSVYNTPTSFILCPTSSRRAVLHAEPCEPMS